MIALRQDDVSHGPVGTGAMRGFRSASRACLGSAARRGLTTLGACFTDMSPEKSQAVAARLLRQIAEATIEAEALPFHFTVSIGVTCFKPTDASIEAVTRC